MNVSRLLIHTVSVARRTGVDVSGTPAYGAPFEVAARVEWSEGRERLGRDGTAKAVAARIVTAVEIGPEDRVWLPNSDMTPGDSSDTTRAYVPGPTGVQPVTGLGGAVDFYLTEV